MSSKQFSRVASPRPPRGRGQSSTRRNKLSVLDLAGHSVPPLHWWRRLPAPAFTTAHVAILRKAIVGIIIANEPNLAGRREGRSGGGGRRGLCVDIKSREWPSPGGDLVMSALLRCAIVGSHTAALVLEFALGHMAANDPACAAVAASWRTITAAPKPHRVSKGA